jgi:hypothetical protein
MSFTTQTGFFVGNVILHYGHNKTHQWDGKYVIFIFVKLKVITKINNHNIINNLWKDWWKNLLCYHNIINNLWKDWCKNLLCYLAN